MSPDRARAVQQLDQIITLRVEQHDYARADFERLERDPRADLELVAARRNVVARIGASIEALRSQRDEIAALTEG